jgi:hypothetical protein
MTYATLEDFYDRLKPEAITNFERGVKSVEAATGTFLAPGHGLQSGYVLRFVGKDLPAGLSAFTTYYALVSGSDFFRISASAGGSAITPFVDSGSGLLSFVVDMSASIQRQLDRVGARIDSCLKQRGVTLPLVGIQPDLAELEIDYSAWKILLARGYQVNRETNPDQDYKVLFEHADERLKDMCKDNGWLPPGIVIGTLIDAPSEAWDANARGWNDTRYYEDGAI